MNEEMYDNNEVMNTEVDLDNVSSSGNNFNYGLAAVAAAVIGALITGGIALHKRIKSKRNAAIEDEEKPRKKDKKIRLGKHKQIVVIDNRKENSDEEE